MYRGGNCTKGELLWRCFKCGNASILGCTVHAPQDLILLICVQVALTTLALSAIGYLTYIVGLGVLSGTSIVNSYISLIRHPCLYACMVYTILAFQNNPHGSERRRSQLWIRSFHVFCLLAYWYLIAAGPVVLVCCLLRVILLLQPCAHYVLMVIVFLYLIITVPTYNACTSSEPD